MKLLKPCWVNHDGFPIFSLDIHPDGSRFATGGQGAGDSGRVVIWNMAPVVDEAQETKENVPKYLSRMDNHLNCVNCVRWSHDGRYLASAGDDKVIMIWQIARYANSSSVGNSAFGGSSNAETWRCVATLRGHSGDILDLNWCSTESRLASCSVDNTVIIWNTEKWHEIIATLSGHTGLVKGVSWDPIGKYVASQSDDKSLKIWRTADWKEEFCLTEPFVECGGTTHVLRLNWSPDGKNLVSAHAMNNCGSTAQIIDREGWVANRDFVGHRKAVTCVRFNPNILKKKKKVNGKEANNNSVKKEKDIYYNCLAVGSRDRSVSIWNTSLTRPLVVIHELFTNSVLDISWTADGRRVLACSWDGTVACIEFENQELGGQSLTKEETCLYLEKVYGKSLKNSSSNSHVLVEDVDIIRAREEKLKNSVPQTNGTVSSHQNDSLNCSLNDSRSNTSSRLLKGPTDKQIEIKLGNGKRRITPLYIPPPTDLDGIPMPYNHQETNFSTSTDQKSKIPIERREDSNLSFASPGKENSSQPHASSSQAAAESSSQLKTPVAIDSEVAKITGKRKPDSKGDASPSVKKRPGRPPMNQPKEISSLPVTQPQENGKSATIKAKDMKVEKRSRIQLTACNIEKSASFRISCKSSIQVENNLRNTPICVVRLLAFDVPKWEVILTNRIVALTASEFMTAVATDDNLVSVYSTETGRKLRLPIVLNSALSKIECRSNYLMAITIEGRLSVWDFKSHSPVVRNESLVPLFNEGNKLKSNLSITTSELTPNGTPVISLSNRKSYIYDLDFNNWSLLSNPNDLVNSSTDLKSPAFRHDPDNYPLARIQSLNSKGISKSSIFNSNSALQSSAAISFIDQQLAAAFVIGSKEEYKFWLLQLAQALTDNNMEERLSELCTFLLGPVFKDPNDDSWVTEVLGHNKRCLLEEVLLIMTSNLRLQRLYSQFKDQLSISTSLLQPFNGRSSYLESPSVPGKATGCAPASLPASLSPPIMHPRLAETPENSTEVQTVQMQTKDIISQDEKMDQNGASSPVVSFP